MKEETKKKIRVKWDCFKTEYLPSFAIGGILGMTIYSYFGTIGNSVRLKKVEQKVQVHSEIIDQHADAGNALVERCKETDEKVEELQRKQELLMENALRITEGRR